MAAKNCGHIVIIHPISFFHIGLAHLKPTIALSNKAYITLKTLMFHLPVPICVWFYIWPSLDGYFVRLCSLLKKFLLDFQIGKTNSTVNFLSISQYQTCLHMTLAWGATAKQVVESCSKRKSFLTTTPAHVNALLQQQLWPIISTLLHK